ncbi:MAG: hypothetical protein AB7E78_14755 [Porticoccaceae bacterium]
MSNFKRLPLAVAVAMAMGTGFSYAEDPQTKEYGRGSHSDIDIDKTVDVDYNLSYYGQIYTLGLVLVDSSAAAFSEVNQKTHDNKLSKLEIDPRTGAVLSTPGSLNDDNNATLGGTVLSDATGNAGVNVAAGSNNVQQNSVAIAEGDSLNSTHTIEIDFSDRIDYVDNESGTWSKDVHFAAGAEASHSVEETDTLTSSSNAHLDVDLDVDDKITVTVPGGEGGQEYSVSSVVGGAALGEFEADIGGDVMSSMGGEQGDLNAVSAEGGFVAGGLLGIEDGTIDYGVAGKDSQTWTGTEKSSKSAHVESSVDYSEEGSWEYQDEHHYAFSASFDINLLFGGAAEAETFSDQYSYHNENPSSGTNDAWLGDDVGSGFSGNIGVNVVAGNNNAQANQLALAENSGVMALATASSNQAVFDNLSVGQGSTKDLEMEVTLKGDGTYKGYSDQLGDDYLDTWDGALPHPSGGSTGHVDVDDQTQNAGDVVYDAAGNLVNPKGQADTANGETELADGGTFVFKEQGTIELELTGNIPVVQVVPNAVVNNATLTGNAFSKASGNIAINVAAGNGNLQGNALAIASIGTPVVAPPPGGGGDE